MSGFRFAAGEIAVFMVASHPDGIPGIGEKVEVQVVGPIHAGDVLKFGIIEGTAMGDADYLVRWPDGDFGLVRDWQLRKLNPPDEPASITYREEVEA